jgi:hypothetical protein
MSEDNPFNLSTGIIIDLSRELHTRVADQIKMTVAIVDTPKDKFRVSLGALSATLGSIGGYFSVAYGLPNDPDLGRTIAIAVMELGEKAKRMSNEEWVTFVQSKQEMAINSKPEA